MADLIRSPDEMRARALEWRRSGLGVAFVPTMGYLHAGHVSLLEAARKRADVLVLSIFVNPAQFGPKEDLSRYPRDLDGDVRKAERAGADVVFLPEPADMYPDGYQTYVEVRELEQGLCGDRRPGHFRGVATVVLKLFNLVQPHLALFGEKDFQQLQIIKRMVHDLHIDVQVLGMPIVREHDGLAMSSRNAYLGSAERQHALTLSRALSAARDSFTAGQRVAETLLAIARRPLADAEKAGHLRLDYLELDDAATLKPLTGDVSRPAVMALAAFVGATRLIDNVQLIP